LLKKRRGIRYLIFEVNWGIEVRDFGIGRFIKHIPLARMHKSTHFWAVRKALFREMYQTLDPEGLLKNSLHHHLVRHGIHLNHLQLAHRTTL
jgi:hypothetical protein